MTGGWDQEQSEEERTYEPQDVSHWVPANILANPLREYRRKQLDEGGNRNQTNNANCRIIRDLKPKRGSIVAHNAQRQAQPRRANDARYAAR